jgi:ribosomal protein RSM22 (predicted rRNA methylase)
VSPELPAALRVAIERALEGVARKDLAARAARTSAAYRAGQASAGVILQADDALAYALTRLPATYAACASVLAEAARMAPDFAPASLLDAGVGTGAASWAALQAWPGLRTATWVDASPTFLTLAARLAADGPAALRDAETLRADLASGASWPRAELVVASYALAEIPADKQDVVSVELWKSCAGVLVLVEPGTPAGYARILQARRILFAHDAIVVAPCPHAGACPLVAPDWCHFNARLPRSRDHRLVKAAEVPFEDERFSYLVAARPSVTVRPRSPRVIAPPRAGKPGMELKLCGIDGQVERRVVGKRDKAAYAVARRLGWGDAAD